MCRARDCSRLPLAVAVTPSPWPDTWRLELHISGASPRSRAAQRSARAALRVRHMPGRRSDCLFGRGDRSWRRRQGTGTCPLGLFFHADLATSATRPLEMLLSQRGLLVLTPGWQGRGAAGVVLLWRRGLRAGLADRRPRVAELCWNAFQAELLARDWEAGRPGRASSFRCCRSLCFRPPRRRWRRATGRGRRANWFPAGAMVVATSAEPLLQRRHPSLVVPHRPRQLRNGREPAGVGHGYPRSSRSTRSSSSCGGSSDRGDAFHCAPRSRGRSGSRGRVARGRARRSELLRVDRAVHQSYGAITAILLVAACARAVVRLRPEGLPLLAPATICVAEHTKWAFRWLCSSPAALAAGERVRGHPIASWNFRPVAALYRKYRPQDFDEVVGQEAVVRTLKNAIARGQVRQAYLFAGPRGTGQDLAGADPRRRRSTARTGPTATPDRHVPRLRRDRRRHVARRDRDGRRLAARDRRHPRDPRPRRAAAGRGPLQGLHPRRGAPAHGRRVERAAEADRGAAAAPRLRLLHDRPREGAADGALALPDVRLPAAAPAGARAACCGASPTARGSTRPTQALSLDRARGARLVPRRGVDARPARGRDRGTRSPCRRCCSSLGAVEEEALFRLCDLVVDRDTAGALHVRRGARGAGPGSRPARASTCSSTCAT